MRSFARRASAAATAATAALALASAVWAAESHEIAFKFTEGEKSSYGIDIQLDITTTAERGGQKQESSARTKKLALVMDVVERAAKEGVRASPELAVTFRDLAVEQEISGAAGEITLEISGEDVVARRGGAVIVDTKEGKGKELAKALLAEFAFIGKEGTLTLRESGRVTKVDGPEAFRSFLAPDSGAGLWILETKPGAIAVGETWESEERRIRRFRGLDLSTNPLAVKVSYTLDGFSERDGRKVAKIKVKSDLLREKSLSATVTGEALRGARVDIRRLERKAEGTVLFDIDEGRLIESDVEVTLAVEVEMTVKNELTKRDETMKTAVTGSGRAVMKLQPAAPEAKEEKPEGGAE
ncbi:MAG: hypothetical protein ACYTKD_01845 [Planctomycetota bacterium]|jgi:hypothetical protein